MTDRAPNPEPQQVVAATLAQLDPDLSVLANLMVAGLLRGLHRQPCRALAGELLETLGLEQHRYDRVADLAPAWRRRFDIAVAALIGLAQP